MSAARGGLQLAPTGPSALRRRAEGPSADQLAREASQALQATFGFDAFRGRQLEAIVAALQGRDAFVLMPTGGGKSLCYSLIPAMRAGLVLVVSPLIALMQDQVAALRARGLQADFLSSTRTEAERRRLLDDLQQPRPSTQLLYVTPELLATESFLRCLRNAYAAGSLLLAAVDEAHCVSSWGHTFRHSYRRLWVLRQELPRLPLMALTATASERVQADIVAQLRLRDPLRLLASFDRPNISMEVRYVEALRGPEGQRLATPLPDITALLERLAGRGPGQQQQQQQQGGKQQQQQQQGGRQQLRVPCTIIYCHRREDADRVASALRKRGVSCAAYHAGLADSVRTRVLEEWTARQVDVVAATTAFGMGVDRADVRCVIHYSLPQSLEGAYQEAGRAGRDGSPARSIIYFSTEDRQRQEFVLGKSDEERQAKRGGSPGSGDEQRPNQLAQFAQVVELCLSARCRRARILRHFGQAPPPRPPAEAARCCDVCADQQAVEAALQAVASAGAQRRQQFAGGKHLLDFGGGGGRAGGGSGGGRGGGGKLEFESSWANEGLDYDQERPSRALQESEDEEEDAIAGSSSDEEGTEAAAAAMQRARRRSSSSSGGSSDVVFAAMAWAEARHEQQHAGGSKKARLLHKLEEGHAAAAGGGGSSSASSLSPELLQTAARQLERVLCGNAALAAELCSSNGSSSSSLAAAASAALVQQLAGGGVSKPVFQSKLSNLAMQLKKAGGSGEVPALSAVLSSCMPAGGTSGGSAAGAGGQAAGKVVQQVQQEQQDQPAQQAAFQQRVSKALRLAEAAGAAANGSAGSNSAVEAAVAALQALAAEPVSVDLLQAGAGKQVRQLSKHAAPAVAAAASAVVEAWKAQLRAQGAR